jgi:Na+/proline symporter
MFFWENGWSNPNHFLKQFLGGIFITIVMTGLDQDMMQKNLSCKNLKEAQKNMFSFSLVLIFVNFIFLCLGALLFVYYEVNSIPFPLKDAGDPNSIAYDLIYPNLAMGYFPVFIGVIFIIGFVAAAYSTADSALTALTTSFCIDILKVNPGAEDQKSIKKRQLSHLLMSTLLVMTIYSFWLINNKSVINQLFTMAGYTYGPLLGLFAFGIFTKRKIRDPYVIIIALASPLLTYLIHSHSFQWFWGYKFGFELLILNGLFSFLGLYLISRKSD